MPRLKVSSNLTQRLLAGMFFYGFILTAVAQTPDEASAPAADVQRDDCPAVFPDADAEKEKPKAAILSFIDATERVVSKQLNEIVRDVDEFFANEKTFYSSTGSYIRLTMDAVWSEGGELGYAGDVRIKIGLPLTQGKLKLLLESDPEEKRDSLDRRVENTPSAAIEKRDYYTGIQASFGQQTSWRFDPSIGVKISAPLEPFVRFRAERNYVLVDDWLMTINGTAYWFDSSGTGYDGLLEFNHRLGDNVIGRATSFVRWTAETDYFSLSQVFSVIHTLSERRAITYLTGVYGNSEPTVTATDYLIAVRYRQALHKDILFLEINPELRFRKVNEFKDEYTLFVKLEMLFKD
jgi:hypothetical protein